MTGIDILDIYTPRSAPLVCEFDLLTTICSLWVAHMEVFLCLRTLTNWTARSISLQLLCSPRGVDMFTQLQSALSNASSLSLGVFSAWLYMSSDCPYQTYRHLELHQRRQARIKLNCTTSPWRWTAVNTLSGRRIGELAPEAVPSRSLGWMSLIGSSGRGGTNTSCEKMRGRCVGSSGESYSV